MELSLQANVLGRKCEKQKIVIREGLINVLTVKPFQL